MSLSLVCFLDRECSMYLAFLFHPCVLRVLHSSTSCIKWSSLSPLFTLTPGLATSLGPLLPFHYKWNQKATFQGLGMLISAPELFSAGNLLCVYLYIGVPTWLTSKHQAKSWLLVFPFYGSLHNSLHSHAWHGKSTSVAILLYNMADLIFLRKWCNLEKLAQAYTRIRGISWRTFCVCRMGRRDNVFKRREDWDSPRFDMAERQRRACQRRALTQGENWIFVPWTEKELQEDFNRKKHNLIYI